MNNIYKKISIEPYISAKNYLYGTKDSRCYITNEKTHMQYLLEGISADLFSIILKTKSYSKAFEFAKDNGIGNELNAFLEELESKDLITISKNKINKNISYKIGFPTNKEIKQTEIFEQTRKEWIQANNFGAVIIFELTFHCNERCIHCYNNKKIRDEISFEDFKRIIDEAYDLGFYYVALTGGEVTEHKDFVKIINYIREKRMSLELLSNAQNLYDKPELFEQVVNAYPNRIKISLYSMNPEIHDKVTGIKGSHKKAIEVIKKLRQHNIIVTINYFQLEVNQGCYSDVVKFQQENYCELSYDNLFVNNKDNKNFHVQANDEQILKLYLDKNSPYFKKHLECNKIDKEFFERSVCRAGIDIVSISPELEVYPCMNLKISLGNLKKQSLIDIWDGKQRLDFQNNNKIKNLQECFKEEYCKYCMYCPGAVYQDNAFMKKSEIQCRLSKLKMKANKINNKK